MLRNKAYLRGCQLPKHDASLPLSEAMQPRQPVENESPPELKPVAVSLNMNSDISESSEASSYQPHVVIRKSLKKASRSLHHQSDRGIRKRRKRQCFATLSSSSASSSSESSSFAFSGSMVATDNPMLLCSDLPSHWRRNKSLHQFTVNVLTNIPNGTRVSLTALTENKAKVEVKHGTALVENQCAVFHDLRFLGCSGRGKHLDIVVFVDSSPNIIGVYKKAIKVTADGPRRPRVKVLSQSRKGTSNSSKASVSRSETSHSTSKFTQNNVDSTKKSPVSAKNVGQRVEAMAVECVGSEISQDSFQPEDPLVNHGDEQRKKWLSSSSYSASTFNTEGSSTPNSSHTLRISPESAFHPPSASWQGSEVSTRVQVNNNDVFEAFNSAYSSSSYLSNQGPHDTTAFVQHFLHMQQVFAQQYEASWGPAALPTPPNPPHLLLSHPSTTSGSSLSGNNSNNNAAIKRWMCFLYQQQWMAEKNHLDARNRRFPRCSF